MALRVIRGGRFVETEVTPAESVDVHGPG